MVKKRQTAAPGPPPRGWLSADELGIMLAFNQLADMLAKELDAEKDEALALRKALLGLIFLTEHLVHLTEVSLSVKPLLHYLVSDFTPLLNHFDDNSEHPLVAGENISALAETTATRSSPSAKTFLSGSIPLPLRLSPPLQPRRHKAARHNLDLLRHVGSVRHGGRASPPAP